MSYEEASRREMTAFEALREAIDARGHLMAAATIYSEHQGAYESAVERLLGAVQAYELASSDLLKARAQ
jgi:hypothetical protein